MVQRAIAVMPALKTSQKLARNSQHIQSAQGIKLLFSTHISPTILVIISGIWLELEIKISHLFDLVKPHVKGTLAALLLAAPAAVAQPVAQLSSPPLGWM